MSRSYKKHMGGKICGSSDKDDKRIYHKGIRSQYRKYLSSFLKDEERPVSKYGFKYADTWNWGSDGGSWLSETDSSLRRKFDEDLFGLRLEYRRVNGELVRKSINSWEHYLSCYEDEYSFHHTIYCWGFVELVVGKHLKKFSSEEEFMNWMLENEESLIKTWKKLNFGK